MAQPLKILIAEDNPADAELVLLELERAGFEPVSRRVDTEAAFLQGLHGGLDLVVSDYQMPEFNGLRALELMKQRGLEIPFILVSGTIGEDVAVEAMRKGAADYLLKDRLVRLGPAAIHAIAECQARRERRHASQVAQRQQAELRVLIDLMPAMIWFKDTHDRILRVNQRVAENVGKSVGEIEGHRSFEIYPRDAAKFYADDLKVIHSGVANLGRVEATRDEQGNESWIQTDKVPVCDAHGKAIGIVVMRQDITERKRAEQSLQLSEKRFKSLFDQAAVGVALADAATGRLVQINRRFCEITGRSRHELEQHTFAGITHPEDVARHIEIWHRIKEGTIQESALEKRFLRKDGSTVWVSLTLSAMWPPGACPDFVIAVALDVTVRKQLEEQLQQTRKMEAIGTLAGGIAHDFNNILTGIVGFTELSRMTLKGDPEVRDYLDSILQTSNRAADLVRQILAFSRQQPGERRPIQLRPVVEEALKLLRATIPSSIEFETSFGTDAPTVLVDPSQIHQVLMNLGTNAWHAMKDRAGRLQITLEKRVVDAALAASHPWLRPSIYACLSVRDTGDGMDPTIQRRIFEPFFTTKPLGGGVGLGLAVVHGIMDTHGGGVTVTSQPGEGTIFRLYFPAYGGAPTVGGDNEDPAPSGHGERILFVDDEEMLAHLGQKVLSALGYAVEITTQPEVALAMIRADPQRFTLVLTDLTMPGMTGLILASQLRQIRSDLPIILMTGYSSSPSPMDLGAMGICELLLKPTTVRSLALAVHAALPDRPAFQPASPLLRG